MNYAHLSLNYSPAGDRVAKHFVERREDVKVTGHNSGHGVSWKSKKQMSAPVVIYSGKGRWLPVNRITLNIV